MQNEQVTAVLQPYMPQFTFPVYTDITCIAIIIVAHMQY